MLISEIAKVCHEINKTYCEFLGDFSQTSWETAPQWQKDSAIKGVQFHVRNPDAPASASHTSWLIEKEATGWVYGPIKDADKKEHPCIVPFVELPREQQLKDHLFRSVVHQLMSSLPVYNKGV